MKFKSLDSLGSCREFVMFSYSPTSGCEDRKYIFLLFATILVQLVVFSLKKETYFVHQTSPCKGKHLLDIYILIDEHAVLHVLK